MAAATSKSHCVTCGKEKVVYKCEGCSQNFCFNHLEDHRKIIEKQLDEVEDKRNSFREIFSQRISNPQEHPLLKQIDQWEYQSIKKIQEVAAESRQVLIKYTTEHIDKIEIELAKLTEQLKQTRQEYDFDEIVLNQFKNELTKLEKELVKPINVSIQQDSSPFINKISVVIPSGKYAYHI